MIKKAALPHYPARRQSTTFGSKPSFEHTDKIDNVFVLQKHMNMIRHHAPCEKHGFSFFSLVKEQLGEHVRKFGKETKPRIFFEGSNGYGEGIALVVRIR